MSEKTVTLKRKDIFKIGEELRHGYMTVCMGALPELKKDLEAIPNITATQIDNVVGATMLDFANEKFQLLMDSLENGKAVALLCEDMNREEKQ